MKCVSSLGHLGANAADNRWMDSRISDLSCNHINNGRQNPMELGSGVNPGFAATDLTTMLIKEIGVRLDSHEGLDYISAHLGSQTVLTWVCFKKSKNFVAQIVSLTTHLTTIQFTYRI